MKRLLPIAACLLFLWANGAAQELTIRGRVVSSETGEPLIGVNIQLRGTDTGTSTDFDGRYEIKAPSSLGKFFQRKSPQPVLVFSFTGFENQEIDVDERALIDVEMKPTATELEAVVVTGTAVGQSPKLLSYGVGRVDETLMTTVPAVDPGAGLQGKVPGLRVNQAGGQPGQGAYFQVRSAHSLANGQQPLLIVDGIFLQGASLADFNTEDIEKVEILKGAAGASLYGSQAANGVIQLFTSRGRDLAVGKTRVVYRGEYGYSETPRRYDLNTFTNREVVDPSGPQPVLGNPTPEDTYTIPLPNLHDYQEEFLFQRGGFQSHYLTFSGRTNAGNYMVSGQRLTDRGIFQQNDGFTRHAFRLNADHLLSEKLEVQVSTMISGSRQDLVAPTANGPGNFLASILFMTPIFDLDVPNEEDGNPYDWDIDNTGMGITNPLYERANSQLQVDRFRIVAGAEANYYARDWLTLSYAAGLDRSSQSFEHFIEKGFLSTHIPGLFGTLVTAGTQGSNGGGIHRSRQLNQFFTSRGGLTIRKTFSGFNLALRANYLYEDLTQQFNQETGEDLAVRGIRSLDNARSNIFIASDQQDIVAHSGFLIGDIDFRQKYIFSGLIRREGSSLFGPEQRWANYHRISAAYRLTEDVRIRGFRELKLRASIGTAGIRPAFEQRFETFDLVNGTVTKNTLGNQFLRPARSTEVEMGVNATFWRAFELEFNYAQIRTEDQVLLVPLSGATGFVGQWRNAGTLESKVYEAGLRTDFARLFRVRNKNFRWELLTTFDRTRQTITQLDVPAYQTGPGPQQSSLFLISEGASFGTMIGEVFATDLDQLSGQEGIDPADYTLNALGYVVRKDQLGTSAEIPFKLLDNSGNPLLETIGDINPDFRMGFAHTLAYKGFSLYTLFDWKKGGDVYNMTRQWLYRDQRHGDLSRYPGTAAGFFGDRGLYNSLVANNHFVEDGSFFMLREAAISLTLQQKQLQRLFGSVVQAIRFSLIGRNLFTITEYSGFHPDITIPQRAENPLINRFPDARGNDIRTPNGDPALFAVDAFNYPLRRTMTFSIQATF